MRWKYVIYEKMDGDGGFNYSVSGDEVRVFIKTVNDNHDCFEFLWLGEFHDEFYRDGGPGALGLLWRY